MLVLDGTTPSRSTSKVHAHSGTDDQNRGGGTNIILLLYQGHENLTERVAL